MVKKVCLDTSAVISILKKDENSKEMLEKLKGCEVYISAITVFELFLRKTHLEVIENLVSRLVVLPFDEQIAKRASEMYKYQNKTGKAVDLRDLFIAATAIHNNCHVLTLDVRDFERIAGLFLL